jgi:hypothetical protein
MNTYRAANNGSGWSIDVDDGSGLPDQWGHFESEDAALSEIVRLSAFEASGRLLTGRVSSWIRRLLTGPVEEEQADASTLPQPS